MPGSLRLRVKKSGARIYFGQDREFWPSVPQPRKVIAWNAAARLAARNQVRRVSDALVDHLAQEIVSGPGEIFDLRDELRLHPIKA